MTRVFISYSSKNRDFVVKLAQDLKRDGFDVWLDIWEIKGRKPYWTEIQEGIESCSHFLFAISPDSIDPEGGASIELFHAGGLKPRPIIVPVMVVSTPYNVLPILISPGRLQIHDCVSHRYAEMLPKIEDALRGDVPTKPDDSQVQGVTKPVTATTGIQFWEPHSSVVVNGTTTTYGAANNTGISRWIPLGVGVVVVMLIIAAGLVALSNGGKPTIAPTLASTTQAIAATRTNTSILPTLSPKIQASTATSTLSPTPSPSLTGSPTLSVDTMVALTLTAQKTQTLSAIAAYTKTPALTPTSSTTFTATPDHQQTLDAIVQLTNTVIAITNSTATATLWTMTPTITPPNTATITARPTIAPSVMITTNKQWSPQVQTISGVDMVVVPSGCFDMGSKDNLDTTPVTQVCFTEPFLIDKDLVTNKQFAQFKGKAAGGSRWTGDLRPRESISWIEARDFCALRGARLPTEAEWEYAARGPDGLAFPWGNNFDFYYTVYSNNSGGQTADVESKPQGVSWVGAFDMSGNVWEWTSSIYDQTNFPYPYKLDDGRENDKDITSLRVRRGGGFGSLPSSPVASADRSFLAPNNTYINVGFRCARSSTSSATATPTISAFTATPIAPVTSNNQWTPQIQKNNGVDMALVPPGCFMMGSLLWPNGDADQKPVTTQCLKQPFWIDKDLVTNAQFAQFNGKAAHASTWPGLKRPRESITWIEARDFCALRGARLPTEAEWEYAARGPSNLMYPWGDQWIDGNAVLVSTTLQNSGQTADIESRPKGVSWVGAFDMVGNVWEWTNTIYDQKKFPYPYNPDDGREDDTNTISPRVRRGGAYNISPPVSGAKRNLADPTTWSLDIGFRCAHS